MTSNRVATVEVGTASARQIVDNVSGAEVRSWRLEPAALGASGAWMLGAEAAERLQEAPGASAGSYLSRLGDSVPLYVNEQPWAPHDILADLLAQRLPEDTTAVRVVTPPEWGSHRQELVRSALEAKDVPHVHVVSAIDAILAATQEATPDSAVRVLLVHATDSRISVATVVRSSEDDPDGMLLPGEPAQWRVTAVAGHDYGGIDIDEAVFSFVTDRVPAPADTALAHQLRDNCRTARDQLSTQPVTELSVPGTEERLRLVRADLDALTGLELRTALAGVLLRVGVPIDDAGPRAHHSEPATPVDFVLFSGELAGMPLAVETLSQLIDLPVHVPRDPHLVAIRGAAMLPNPDSTVPAVASSESETAPVRRWVLWPALKELRLAIPSRRTVGVLTAALALVVALPLGARALPDDIATVLNGISNGATGKFIVHAPEAQAATVEPDWVVDSMTDGIAVAEVPAGGKVTPKMIGTLKGVATREPIFTAPKRPRPSATSTPDNDPVTVQGTRTAAEPDRAPRTRATSGTRETGRTTAAAPASTRSSNPTTTARPSASSAPTSSAPKPSTTQAATSPAATQPNEPATSAPSPAAPPVTSAPPAPLPDPSPPPAVDPEPEPDPDPAPDPEPPVSHASEPESPPVGDPTPDAGGISETENP